MFHPLPAREARLSRYLGHLSTEAAGFCLHFSVQVEHRAATRAVFGLLSSRQVTVCIVGPSRTREVASGAAFSQGAVVLYPLFIAGLYAFRLLERSAR